MSENSEDYPPDFELPLNRPQVIDDFKFTPLKVVGKGSFGIVYQISSASFEQPLALKIVLQDRRYKNRELALVELHSGNVAHRDVKPANVLVDPQTLRAVLCDFGSAKALKKGEPNVSYICSRFYRAPELILGASHYGLSIDIWSYGCILAEVLLGQPLFPGESSVDQFVEIVKVLGSPSGNEFAAMNAALDDVRMKEVKPYGLAKVFRQKTHQDAVDLISQCLQFDPNKRPTAVQILQHPFFAKIASVGKQLPGGEPVFDRLLVFTDAEKNALGNFVTNFAAKQEGVALDDLDDMEV